MVEKIKKIINYSINAPSGDNSQPWRFSISGSTLNIFNLPEADDSIYNFRQRGSLIAHGALLENIRAACGSEGLSAKITIQPDASDPDLTSTVEFTESAKTIDPLFDAIANRATNRKPYETRPLAAEQKQTILEAARAFPDLRLRFLEDRKKITQLGTALSLNERLILENKTIHDSLFKFIRWGKEEELKTRTGLYVKTLELATPQEFAFKLFRRWAVINFLNNFHIAKLVAKDSAKLYASSSAFGLITFADYRIENFILAGRMLQKIWLTATNLNLNIQPTAALLYLEQRIQAGDTQIFSNEQIKQILAAKTEICEIFNVNTEKPAMLFRIGSADRPTAGSLKKMPLIKIL